MPTNPTGSGVPIPADAAIDLHLHTLASDGFWTPDALVDHLAERGFRVAAVCDHDTQRSVTATTALAAARGITVIPGVEMTCSWEQRQLHVLIYGVSPDRTDPAASAFLACTRDVDQLLQERAADARDRIEASGRALPSLDEYRAGRPLWPFHVLSTAIKEGHVKNLTEAAKLVVELGGTFTADLPLGRVVEAAQQAGGVAIIAHPGRADAVGVVTSEDLDAYAAAGIRIDGIEAHYRSHSDEQTASFRQMADARGMLVSAGSDSHAPGVPVDPKPWRAGWCADLLERLAIPVAASDGPVWTPGMATAPVASATMEKT